MASYSSPHDSQFFTRRAITFTVAVGVQVLIVLLLSTGLASRVINIVAPPIQTDIVQEVQKHDEAPPPPPPKMERPPVEIPPVDVAINVPSETRTTAITNVTDKPVKKAPPPAPPVHHVTSTIGVNGKNFPNVNDFYPPASTRLGEEGTSQVHVCVGPNGRLVQPAPTIAKSSGHSRLDEAAIRLAQAGSGRYKPATEDGKPISACTTFSVKFQLQ
ncbi:MAG TPA: energy transducer TonB [Steroidobacteraceae bacterium]|nr:energy transducer TonB [Steroidobacteraceae bacterium]